MIDKKKDFVIQEGTTFKIKDNTLVAQTDMIYRFIQRNESGFYCWMYNSNTFSPYYDKDKEICMPQSEYLIEDMKKMQIKVGDSSLNFNDARVRE